jgi:proteasome lid subunit RPN8/RPN11
METATYLSDFGVTRVAIHLSEALNHSIREHGQKDYPHECCGVLLGTFKGDDKTVISLKALPNVHEEGHERRYLIAPDEMFRLDKEARAAGQSILGFYHSHPDHPARPSEYDREWAWPWYSYIIVSVVKGESKEMTCWALNEDRAAFDAEEIVISL